MDDHRKRTRAEVFALRPRDRCESLAQVWRVDCYQKADVEPGGREGTRLRGLPVQGDCGGSRHGQRRQPYASDRGSQRSAAVGRPAVGERSRAWRRAAAPETEKRPISGCVKIQKSKETAALRSRRLCLRMKKQRAPFAPAVREKRSLVIMLEEIADVQNGAVQRFRLGQKHQTEMVRLGPVKAASGDHEDMFFRQQVEA